MYQYQSQNTETKYAPRGGKSITQIHNKEDGILVDANTVIYDKAYGKPNGTYFNSERAFDYLDYNGEYVYLSGEIFDKDGNSIGQGDGWVKISQTNFDPEDPDFKKIIVWKKTYDKIKRYRQDESQIIDNHNKASLNDYNKKKPNNQVQDYNDIPSEFKSEYTDRGNEFYEPRFDEEVKLKQKLADDIINVFEKNYGLKSIFDPKELESDALKDPDEQEYYKSDFPNGEAKMSTGYYPKEGEDATDMMDMDDEWTATMEVLYDANSDKDDPIMKQIAINLPITGLIAEDVRKDGAYAKTDEQLQGKMNLLAIMMAHEYIHSAQNTKKIHADIAKVPKLKPKEKKKRKAMRELLAYHFTLFPNKKYADPKDDPVFFSTKFKRGETTGFSRLSDLEEAFFVWKALDYLNRFKGSEDLTGMAEKYKVAEMEKDYLAKMREFEEGPYQIDFDPADGELAAFFATQDSELKPDYKFMNYLMSKKGSNN
jgi:hypothetical protein